MPAKPKKKSGKHYGPKKSKRRSHAAGYGSMPEARSITPRQGLAMTPE